jgi:hypothetical protein
MLALGAGLTPAALLAQNEPPPAEGGAPGEEKGRSLDGYILAGCLAGGVLFLVGKSARRS